MLLQPSLISFLTYVLIFHAHPYCTLTNYTHELSSYLSAINSKATIIDPGPAECAKRPNDEHRHGYENGRALYSELPYLQLLHMYLITYDYSTFNHFIYSWSHVVAS